MEIIASRRNGKVFRISNKIDSEDLLNKYFIEDFDKATEENVNKVIEDITGQPAEEFKKSVEEGIKKIQKANEEKKKNQ